MKLKSMSKAELTVLKDSLLKRREKLIVTLENGGSESLMKELNSIIGTLDDIEEILEVNENGELT